MKREKRNYIVLMIASFLLIFSSLGIYSTIESHLFYGRTQGTVISVKTEKYEHSGPDDTTNHTESDILCSYTVGDKEYAVRYKYKNDFSGLEGKAVTVLYNKNDPYESVIEETSIRGAAAGVILTIICLSVIVYDIKHWVNIRKAENESISRSDFSEPDMQQYNEQMRKQRKINIILIIASVFGLSLFMLDIPLIVYTIARNVDDRLCNSPKNAENPTV